ncbi:DUF6301 family protein [Rhodococcus globerulus]|uniref:DUF6301 family protein n=1 Tax=Rhodococcus globerulus TaxID=33008 RepID=UPI00374F4B35
MPAADKDSDIAQARVFLDLLNAEITTDLNIARPGGAANIVANSVQKINFSVTDRLGTQEAESSGLPGVWFNGLSHRLLTELGLPTRREEDRMRWDLPTVVVTAYRGKRDCFVNIASPQYRAEQDQIDEYQIDEYIVIGPTRRCSTQISLQPPYPRIRVHRPPRRSSGRIRLVGGRRRHGSIPATVRCDQANRL